MKQVSCNKKEMRQRNTVMTFHPYFTHHYINRHAVWLKLEFNVTTTANGVDHLPLFDLFLLHDPYSIVKFLIS